MKKLAKCLLLSLSLTTVIESKRHREEDNKQCSGDICNLGHKCALTCVCATTSNADCLLFNGNISSTSEIWDMFSLKPYLQTLSLQVKGTGAVNEVPTRAIQRLENLRNLTIKYASITRLTSNAFANSKSLREIYLIDSGILRLDSHSVSNLPNLTILNLEDNEISELRQDVFVFLPSLKKLSLSYNNLTIMHEGCFKRLTALLELKLHANDISTLTKENFKGLTNLEILDLSRNELKILGNYLFTEAKSLKEISLGENKLEIISNMAFNGLIRLERLSMENNRLKSLDSRIFRGMNRLIYVDISYNRISNLTNDTVSPILNNIERHGRESLKLQGNPFSCDCGLAWIYHVYNATGNEQLKKNIANITCNADSELSRQLIGVITTPPPKHIRGKIYYNNVEEDGMYAEEEIKQVKVIDIPFGMLPCPQVRPKDQIIEPTLNEVKNSLSSARKIKSFPLLIIVLASTMF